jgi:hypothetical protein
VSTFVNIDTRPNSNAVTISEQLTSEIADNIMAASDWIGSQGRRSCQGQLPAYVVCHIRNWFGNFSDLLTAANPRCHREIGSETTVMFRKGAAVAAMAISALCISAGTATADPTQETPDVHFQANVVDRSVVLTMDAGALAVGDGHLQFIDRSGTSVATLPLTYVHGGSAMPIAAQLDGDTVTLTPSIDPADARPISAATAQEIDALSHPNYNAALGNFSMSMMAAATVGSLLGSAIGGGIGCVAGGIVGGATGGVVSIGLLAVPAAIGGCLITGAALAGMGAVAGTVIVGVPALIAAGIQFWNDTH